jgi:hypothetical protein
MDRHCHRLELNIPVLLSMRLIFFVRAIPMFIDAQIVSGLILPMLPMLQSYYLLYL